MGKTWGLLLLLVAVDYCWDGIHTVLKDELNIIPTTQYASGFGDRLVALYPGNITEHTYVSRQRGVSTVAYVVDPPVGTETVRTVVMVHGFPDNQATFYQNAHDVAKDGARVIIPSLTGYRPPYPDWFFPARNVFSTALLRDLEDLLDEFKVRKATIIGHDWGGVLALAAAANLPERVNSIVSIAIPNNIPMGVVHYPDQLLNSWYMIFFLFPVAPKVWLQYGGGVETLFRLWSPAFEPDQEYFQLVEETFQQPETVSATISYYRQNVGLLLIYPVIAVIILMSSTRGRFVFLGIVALSAALYVSQEPTTVDALASMDFYLGSGIKATRQVATLSINGMDDGCMKTEIFETTMSRFKDEYKKGLRVVHIPDAGHFVHLERPADVNHVIHEWLSDKYH